MNYHRQVSDDLPWDMFESLVTHLCNDLSDNNLMTIEEWQAYTIFIVFKLSY